MRKFDVLVQLLQEQGRHYVVPHLSLEHQAAERLIAMRELLTQAITFAGCVTHMRDAQRAYFKARKQDDLIRSKELERAVDRSEFLTLLDNYWKGETHVETTSDND